MMDESELAGAATGSSYEPRKSSRRGGAERVEVLTVRAERRRRWSSEDKLRIVRETLAPGAVAKVVAERHGVSTGLLFTWRKELLATAVSGFVPVEMAPAEPLQLPGPTAARMSSPAPAAAEGGIEIVLPGGALVRLGRGADLELLRGVLALLAPR
ncbi:transposase [Roseomonas sp. M0104]|uniref:Transposase n=1 Tax=Teichococcus coralli TaxID=2545983 RepID=A0A845BEX4_9PROT|nr:transposase [Pseudoroseomonas coralli]MXP66113.1 transposase [Pseudoroseomonas coralli]